MGPGKEVSKPKKQQHQQQKAERGEKKASIARRSSAEGSAPHARVPPVKKEKEGSLARQSSAEGSAPVPAPAKKKRKLVKAGDLQVDTLCISLHSGKCVEQGHTT